MTLSRRNLLSKVNTAARLAQLDKRRSAEREADDSNPNSNPCWTNKQDN